MCTTGSGCCKHVIKHACSTRGRRSTSSGLVPTNPKPQCQEDAIGEQLAVCFIAVWWQGLSGQGEVGRGRTGQGGRTVLHQGGGSTAISCAPSLAE